jgi:hypothetical protein
VLREGETEDEAQWEKATTLEKLYKPMIYEYEKGLKKKAPATPPNPRRNLLVFSLKQTPTSSPLSPDWEGLDELDSE